METTTTEVQESVADQTETAETEASDQQTEDVSSETTEAEGSDTGTGDQESNQAESGDEPPLPKWLQKYDKDLVDEFQDRFQLTQEQLDDPQRKSLFKAVLDKEQYIKELQGKNLDESEKAGEETVATQTQSPDEQFTQYSKSLDEFVSKGRNGQPLSDPRMQAAFENDFALAFGIKTPEALEEQKKAGFDPARIANAFSKYGVSLIATVLPMLLENAVETRYQGFGKLFDSATEGNSWEGLRGNESYSQLPEYGSQAYRDAMSEVEKANPWFKDAQFKSHDARLQALASLSLGRRVDPKLMEQAVATGKKQADNKTRQVTAAKSLGAGKSKGDLATKEEDNPILRGYAEAVKRGGAFARNK